MSLDLAFIGRKKEIAQLRQLYRERKHALILGEAGIGKTALLRQVRVSCPMLLCEETSTLVHVCEHLERQLGWKNSKMNLIARKNKLLAELEERGELMAFDHAASTPPRVARFIAHLLEKTPVWIASRCSSLAKDIGNIWSHIHHFSRIELTPFALHESAALIEAVVAEGSIQADSAQHAPQLHQMAHGNPRILCELLAELESRKYDMSNTFGLHLLDLDRRIHAVSDEAQTLTKSDRS